MPSRCYLGLCLVQAPLVKEGRSSPPLPFYRTQFQCCLSPNTPTLQGIEAARAAASFSGEGMLEEKVAGGKKEQSCV